MRGRTLLPRRIDQMAFTRRNTLTALFVAIALVFSFAASSKALTVKEGDLAPDFEITSLDGAKVKLSSYKGKVVLLAFWASWCPRCLEELAFLQELYKAHGDKLTVLAVNQDTKNLSETHLAKLKSTVAEMNLGYPILIDLEFDAWLKYGINALPTSVIVNPEGKIAFAEPNYYWASQNKIKGILASMGIGKAED